MSRIENDKIELIPVPTDLISVFADMKDLFSAQLQEHGIDFSVDTSAVKDAWVMCDKNRLNRVVLNLLSNTCKFTPQGGKVSVTLKETGRTGTLGAYEIQVRDSGIGMSKEFSENLFKPFERERTSTVSGIQGTGLGMSITKGIVDLMGGSIDVHTEPEKGSEFVVQVSFPIIEAPGEKAEAAQDTPVDLSKTRLLLVEDNAINMEIASMILEQAGAAVEKAENGQIAKPIDINVMIKTITDVLSRR